MSDLTWPAGVCVTSAEFWLQWNVSRTESPFTKQQQRLLRPGERFVSKVDITRRGSDARAFDAFIDKMKGGTVAVLMPDFRRRRPAAPAYGSLADYAASIGAIGFDDGSYFDTETAGGLLTEGGFGLVTEDGDPLCDEVPPTSVGSLLTEGGDSLMVESSTLPGGPAWALAAEDPPAAVWSWESDETPQLLGGSGSELVVAGLTPDATVLLAGDLIQIAPGRAVEVAEDFTTDDFGGGIVAVQPAIRWTVVPGPLVATDVVVRMRLTNPDEAPRNPTRAPVISDYSLELAEDLNDG